MFEVKAIVTFSAAHYLKKYKGKCESLHGHNWRVEAKVSSKKLDYRGMVIDFKDLKSLLREITSELDHKLLNDIPYFSKQNTTSELIARYIFRELSAKLRKFLGAKKSKTVRLEEIAVWEQDNSCAVYRDTDDCR
ncbi:MAG: 6-carboxytetrahydropterin synthase QueD [Candidatus Omnitrophica bacterium 4484_171]|nr:MAG: 6-carboxytetrahydropterin synthase QueD [Candidatus Omnitrophica bacterium 4484_171]